VREFGGVAVFRATGGDARVTSIVRVAYEGDPPGFGVAAMRIPRESAVAVPDVLVPGVLVPDILRP
jgi:hypothetical protein